MKTLIAFVTGGLAVLLVIGLIQMRAATHARTSVGEKYHRMVQRWELAGNWNHDWEQLKSLVDREHRVRLEGVSQRGGGVDVSAMNGADERGLGSLRLSFEQEDIERDVRHGSGSDDGTAERLAERYAAEAAKEEALATATRSDGNAQGRGNVQQLNVGHAVSSPVGSMDGGAPEDLGVGEGVVTVSEEDEEGNEAEVKEGTEAMDGAERDQLPQSASGDRPASKAAPQPRSHSAAASRDPVSRALRRLDPVRVRVAAIMGTTLRVPGLTDRTRRPCLSSTGHVTLCGLPRTPRTARTTRGRPAQPGEEVLSDDVGGGLDQGRKLQPGDQGYKGVDMYKHHFSGSFVMNQEKYSKLPEGEPVRITKYKSQCALDQWPAPNSPPRGCDTAAATAENPRSRGYDRVGQVNSEFLKLLPEVDVFRALPKFESCAVVGNGGSLLLNEMGAEIDRHQAVIRFNGGITKGFEKYVGSRTTVRILNTQHIGFHEFEEEMLLQHATNQNTMEAVLIHHLKHPDTTMFITDGDFHQYVLDEMGDGAASNGFYGVVFAKEMCKSVTLYGFYKNWGPKQAGTARVGSAIKYHYYDKVEPNVSQKGRDDKETPALLDFLARHRGLFRFGEPTAVGAMDM